MDEEQYEVTADDALGFLAGVKDCSECCRDLASHTEAASPAQVELILAWLMDAARAYRPQENI